MKKIKLLLTALMAVAIVALSVGCPHVDTAPIPILETPTISVGTDDASWMDFTKNITISNVTTFIDSYYFTTNGDTPTTESTRGSRTTSTSAVRTLDFLLGAANTNKTDKSFTLKVIAVKAGYITSSVAEMTFNEEENVPKPTITPDGGTFAEGVTVTLTSIADAKIYYTKDSTGPTADSLLYDETAKIILDGIVDIEIKALAIKLGVASEVTSATFKLGKLTPPIISPFDGSVFNGAPEVTLTSDTVDAKIYYTFGEDVPTTGSDLYDENAKPTYPSGATIKISAIATKEGYTNSEVESATFTREKVAKPTISSPEADDTFTETLHVTLTATEGTTIYYTTSATADTIQFTAYSEPFPITETTTVKAIAKLAGYTDSDIESKTFTLVGTPVIDIPAGTDASNFDYSKTITFSNAVDGANYYYTTDESTPTESDSSATSIVLSNLTPVPTSPVTVSVIAIGSKGSSPVIKRAFIQIQVKKPSITLPANTVATNFDYDQTITFGSDTTDATFDYTIGDTTGTANNINLKDLNVTSSPVAVSVIAKKKGYADSEANKMDFTKMPDVLPVVITPIEDNRDFDGSADITLTSATVDAIITYKIDDGAVETYTEPFRVGSTLAKGDTITIVAYAKKSGLKDAPEATATFTKTGLIKTVLVEANVAFQTSVDSKQGIATKFAKLTKNYYMGVYEVTQGQYRAVIGGNPAALTDAKAKGDNFPVETLTWLEAAKFCNKLSEKEELTPYYSFSGETVTIENASGTGYRLPTEVEWEYAARGGKNTSEHAKKYAGSDDINKVAWYKGNTATTGTSGGMSKEVGLLAPNALDIYDMSGNVAEFCFDVQQSFTSYPLVGSGTGTGAENKPMVNPTGGTGTVHIRRGGTFTGVTNGTETNYSNTNPLVAWRGSGVANYQNGFRVVRNAPVGP